VGKQKADSTAARQKARKTPARQRTGRPAARKKKHVYYTARHLLEALQNLDGDLLDLPLVLVHGKALRKPNLVQGFIPSPVPVDRKMVEAKRPSILTVSDLG
jgi:hypothetical protein